MGKTEGSLTISPDGMPVWLDEKHRLGNMVVSIVFCPSVYETTEQLLAPAFTATSSEPAEQLALVYVWYITLPSAHIGAMLWIMPPCSIVKHAGARVTVTATTSLEVALQLRPRA
jgi:hypothetical protein